jgi:hypothetical protein
VNTDLAMAYAFGRLVERPTGARPPGLLAATADALTDNGLLDPLLDCLEPDYAASLRLAIILDRQAGRKRP